jgi:hypothetical protein
MDNVIQFPGKDQRQWAGVAEELKPFLSHLGATDQEILVLLKKLQPRWEQLGRSFQLKQQQYSIPEPITFAQIEAINAALQAQAEAIAGQLKTEHGQTLLEFAKLEFQLLRLGGELA